MSCLLIYLLLSLKKLQFKTGRQWLHLITKKQKLNRWHYLAAPRHIVNVLSSNVTFSHHHTASLIFSRSAKWLASEGNTPCCLRPNSICLICCGFVVQQAVQENRRQIHNKSKQCSSDFDLLSTCCSATFNHKAGHSDERINKTRGDLRCRYLRTDLQQIK